MVRLQLAWYSRRQDRFARDLSFTQAALTFQSRSNLHAYMHHYFHHLAQDYLRRHRNYFVQERRGFGEDAFHALWFLLMREFRPQRCLEIGVYRGQIISLWRLLAEKLGFAVEVHGISPFTAVDDEVSLYPQDVDYEQDVIANHDAFGLHRPTLLRALSTDPAAREYVTSRAWDLVYIDGSHDYETVLSDYTICRDSLSERGLLVMDDSSLRTDYKAPKFSFAGHPAPSRVMQERAMHELSFLAGVGHNNVFIRKTRQ
jgi:predicted O-methyltransferase YrrM